ncbi:nucleotidyltransferase domain-containing protein [Pseudodesulfovibrio sp.]|uniref:nucleotidyltransferase domain-containing protein n=1 Tax=unclassified Pseudodesulfovibrio TaxID=2661612 RepID=UPI003B00C62A
MSSTSIMLFGSVARGDNSENSDIDYLVVSDKAEASIKCDLPNASTSKYTWVEFNELVDKKMLFIQHLKQEGVILSDEGKRLEKLFTSFSPKSSYRKDFDETQSLLKLLSVIPEQNHSRLWYSDVLFVIFRNLMITHLADQGKYIFSPKTLASSFGAEVWQMMKVIREAKHAYRQRKPHNCPSYDFIMKTINTATAALSIEFKPSKGSDDQFVSNLTNLTATGTPWYRRVRAAEGLLSHTYGGNIPSDVWSKHKNIITNQIGYRSFSSHFKRDEAIFQIVEDALCISL